MPKPDTSLGSSGYPTEFYEKTTDPVKSGKVKPRADVWKKQMGIDPNSKERQRFPVPQLWRTADLQKQESTIQQKINEKKTLTKSEQMFFDARMKKGAPLKPSDPSDMGGAEWAEETKRRNTAIDRLYKNNQSTPAGSSKQTKSTTSNKNPQSIRKLMGM